MLLGVRVAIAPCLLGGANAGETGRVTPNRTLPKVAPPKTALEFSANPTAREIAEARVFQEPLVSVGGEPGAEENAALARALLGYAQSSGPDDFSALRQEVPNPRGRIL